MHRIPNRTRRISKGRCQIPHRTYRILQRPYRIPNRCYRINHRSANRKVILRSNMKFFVVKVNEEEKKE